MCLCFSKSVQTKFEIFLRLLLWLKTLAAWWAMSTLDLWPELHLPWRLMLGSLLNVFYLFCSAPL